MFKILTVFLFLFVSVNGVCQPAKNLIDSSLVNCPQCKFLSADKTVSGSGNKYSVNCPSGHTFWWYLNAKEFREDVSLIGSKYTIECDGSSWKLTIPNQPKVQKSKITAIVCGDRR
ncbi:unnamed protein product [Caenorhabditis angaria]|uniref:C6 domain-containing protein n=1 Tax=Caenorhabditis angaria TaxID=860376 RepID=A0A9P1MT33_9PELO|nr:unnamed protein product [Caenorhabditis angaria]